MNIWYLLQSLGKIIHPFPNVTNATHFIVVYFIYLFYTEIMNRMNKGALFVCTYIFLLLILYGYAGMLNKHANWQIGIHMYKA